MSQAKVVHMKGNQEGSFMATKCGTYNSFFAAPKSTEKWEEVTCRRCHEMHILERKQRKAMRKQKMRGLI